MFWLTLALASPSLLDGSDPTSSDIHIEDELLDEPAYTDPDAGLRSRVVGGFDASLGDWPSTVGIVYNGTNVQCTGTLIAPDVVMTAAHCVDQTAPSHILANTVNLNGGGQYVPVTSSTYHPSYNGFGGVDIAVLQLAFDAPVTPSIIASDCVAAETLYDGAPTTIVGFGATNNAGNQYTNILQEAVSTIQDADCSESTFNGYASACDTSLATGTELFAGGSGTDACFGDSGGPLYVQGTDGIWYVSGVTSRGSGGPSPCGYGGVWVRPDSQLAWMEGIVGPLDRPICGTVTPPPQTPPPQTPPPQTPTPETPPPTDPTPEPTPPPSAPTPPQEEEEEPEEEPAEPTPPSEVSNGLEVVTNLLLVEKNTLGQVQVQVRGAEGPVAYTISSEPQLGDALVGEDGVLWFWPHQGRTGADYVEILVDDGSGEPVQARVDVSIYGNSCSHAPGGTFLFPMALLCLVTRRRSS